MPYVHTPSSEQTKQYLGRGDHKRMLPKVKQICPAPSCCQHPWHVEDARKISAKLAASKQSWRDRVWGLICFCFLIGVLYKLVLHRKIFCLLGGILCLTVLPTPAKICVLLLSGCLGEGPATRGTSLPTPRHLASAAALSHTGVTQAVWVTFLGSHIKKKIKRSKWNSNNALFI